MTDDDNTTDEELGPTKKTQSGSYAEQRRAA